MKKQIVILEDNEDRRKAMEEWFDDRLSMYGLLLTDDPDTFMQYVRNYSDDILAISLDHDLHERADESTDLTGMLVVDRLVQLVPSFPILLHTSNRHDGAIMQSRLKKSGWSVDWVIPFDSTSWVATDWYYALKKAIRGNTRRVFVTSEDDAD